MGRMQARLRAAVAGLRRFVREANAGSAAVIRVQRPWADDGPLRWRAEWGGPLLVGRYLPEPAAEGEEPPAELARD